MVGHVDGGPEQTAFFVAPQAQPNRPPWPKPGHSDDTHGLHHRGHAPGIVRGSGTAVPRVQMGTKKNDLVGSVRPWQIRKDIEVVRFGGLFGETRTNFELDGYGNAMVEQANHPVVVLNGQRDLRQRGDRIRIRRSALLHHHRAAIHARRDP